MTDKINNGLIDFDNLVPSSNQTPEITPELSLDKLRSQNAAADEAEKLIAMCKNENELLELRNKIIDTDFTTVNKKELLLALDHYVIQKIAPIIQEASLFNKRKQDKKDAFLGAIGIIVVGIIVAFFWPIALPISIILSALGLVGNFMSNKEESQSSEAAMGIVEKYRKAGYPIDQAINNITKN